MQETFSAPKIRNNNVTFQVVPQSDKQKAQQLIQNCESYKQDELAGKVHPSRDVDLHNSVEQYRFERLMQSITTLQKINELPSCKQKPMFNYNITKDWEQMQSDLELLLSYQNAQRDPSAVKKILKTWEYLRVKARKARKKQVSPKLEDVIEREAGCYAINQEILQSKF